MKQTLISFVIPCYNEVGNIATLHHQLTESTPRPYRAEYIYVDDGSSDGTLGVIMNLMKKDKRVRFISFTRNFGHQYALKAGIDAARGEAVISLDSDLEHPPQLIPKMVSAWSAGAKIVYTKRLEDASVPILKRLTSKLFYRFINALSDTKIDTGSADFRLLDQEVARLIKSSQESTLFLRGLVMWSGYSTAVIPFVPHHRTWGHSKYTYSKMIHLAIDAITSFSIIPLRFATLLGLGMSFFTGLYGLYALIAWFTDWNIITGWPSVIISVLFIGGLQLLMLGIIGEYIGKIFLETKRRPLYIVKERSL